MTIFLTGDIHGSMSIRKLGTRRFDAKHPTPLTRDDFMVILGDFGLFWRDPPDGEETWWLNWLENRPWTTLVVLGNHENYRMIRGLPTEAWRGGRVRRFREHVLQLVDNEIFDIDGKTFFVRGGAYSLDRHRRTPGVTWWREEVPNEKERAAALAKLARVSRRVDHVLTHEAPAGVFAALGAMFPPDEYAWWLQHLAERLSFDRWFFGHHHQDRFDLGRYTGLYHRIADLDGRPAERCL